MDVSGSFLELSCVRIALIPIGASIADHRFEQLSSYIKDFRQIPLRQLPRRAPVPRSSGNATFSSMPVALRDVLSNDSPPLARSLSASRDGHRERGGRTEISVGSNSDREVSEWEKPPVAQEVKDIPSHAPLPAHALRTGSRFQKDIECSAEAILSRETSSRGTNERAEKGSAELLHRQTVFHGSVGGGLACLDMSAREVDASFRLRYEVVPRDHAGALMVRPASEWDEFHSSKVWGVIGILDIGADNFSEKHLLSDAVDDFRVSLSNFDGVPAHCILAFVRNGRSLESNPNRLIPEVFRSPAALQPDGIMIIREGSTADETLLEIRAHIVQFAGNVFRAIDRDCWKRRESPHTELFFSPIDEKHNADRQSKLAKRRAGRLDKLLADSLLLMGSPRDALTKYNSAIERAKASSDRLWLAGAMEGWSAAFVLNHVGSGGHLDDSDLSDRLIEHYSEVYKLYQKKRVAEPEAAAALRLAEFLGTWTKRRKDALTAAEHAATVGEGLRAQKRASLWEALARFSERMGCRRKAALYLYRLGLLNASQSCWSSAVELMVASERQLSVGRRRPWAGLSRQVLLLAATYAEEANDSPTAAKLYVEALVTSPEGPDVRVADEAILKSLRSSQVPSYLPATCALLSLKWIAPMQMPGLFAEPLESANDFSEETAARDGPFIYNPFEARKRAKAAAGARKAVTWVSGEKAQIALHLVTWTKSAMTVDVIAVLVTDEDSSTKQCDSSESGEASSTLMSDIDSTVSEHARSVRDELERASALAATISETITIDPKVPGSSRKSLSIVPKCRGRLFLSGILVRLFGGALVVLRAPLEVQRTAVDILGQLPKLEIRVNGNETGSAEAVSNKSQVTVYDGESREFSLNVNNCGAEPLHNVSAAVGGSHPALLRTTATGTGNGELLEALREPGGSQTIRVKVRGREDVLDHDDLPVDSEQSSCTVSVVIRYEGRSSHGVFRECAAVVKLFSRPALHIRRTGLTGRHVKDSSSADPRCIEVLGVVEVSNEVSVPAAVTLSGDITCHVQVKPAPLRAPEASPALLRGPNDDHRSDETCLVECGAAARVTCTLGVFERAVGASQTSPQNFHSGCSSKVTFQILWSLPALGRHGALRWSSPDLRWTVSSLCPHVPIRGVQWQIPMLRHPLRISFRCLGAGGNTLWTSMHDGVLIVNSGVLTTVKAGAFWNIEVCLENWSNSPLPNSTVLHVHMSHGRRSGSQALKWTSVSGFHESIEVGSLCRSDGEMKHFVRGRVLSVGTFLLCAQLRVRSPLMPQSQERAGVSPASTEREGKSESQKIGRRRRLLASSSSVHRAVHPTTVDTYPDGEHPLARTAVLATSVVKVLAT